VASACPAKPSPGQITSVTDNLGSVIPANRSRSMIRIADPKPDCLFAFTGHPFDKEVGLQSNEPRHYDPNVGRWLNEEHIGYQPDGDLYHYAGGGKGDILLYSKQLGNQCLIVRYY
jgi:RHS repeat-associated protein